MILPRAQTACSHTFWCGECNSRKKCSTEPANTTDCVCAVDPDAIFVSAQAASNCKVGWSSLFRQSTRIGSIPASIIWSIGGFLSLESSLRASCTALSFTWGSSLIELANRSEIDVFFWLTSSSVSSPDWAAWFKLMFRFFSTVSSFLCCGKRTY